jgi:hypothetical protein
MAPGLRKVALTAHVTSSVGWLGAVATFLALALAGLISKDAQLVRAAYLMMELTGWFVLVPLSLASLLTGLVQALGTPWGLFRHYWVLFKLLITVLATVVLLLYMQTLTYLRAEQQTWHCPVAISARYRLYPRCFTLVPGCCYCLWPRRWRCTSRGA